MREAGRFGLGLLLTGLAGWIDGVGFLEFGGLYLSFMSGNTIQLGIGTAAEDVPRLIHTLGAIGTFAVGAFAGGLLFATGSRWAFALGLTIQGCALVLALALALNAQPPPAVAIMPIAFAMGFQNQIVAKRRSDSAGTTFITGTLFRFGDGLARLVAGEERPGQVLRLFLVVVTFGIGASGGAFAAFRYGALALALPAGLSLLLAGAALLAELVRALRTK